MSEAQCIGIWGRRGAGKTTRARKLLKTRRRVVAFDPVGEFNAEGFWECSSLDQVLELLKGNWGDRYRIAYVPTGDYPRMLHGLADLVWRAFEPLQGRRGTNVTLLVEEMSLGFPAHKLPARLTGMGRVTLLGRHRGIEVIGVAQRPSLVSADFRGQLHQAFALQLPRADDRAAVLADFSIDKDPGIATLEPLQYFHLTPGAARKGRDRHR